MSTVGLKILGSQWSEISLSKTLTTCEECKKAFAPLLKEEDTLELPEIKVSVSFKSCI